MPYIKDNLENTFLMFILMVIILFLAALVFYFKVVVPFVETRNYIKMEMKRSGVKHRRYWKKKLRKHYISHIPVIGRFFR